MRTCLVIAFACILTNSARADFIVSQSYTEGGGLPVKDYGIRVWVELATDDYDYFFPVTPLFNIQLTPADLGKTFTANASSPFFGKNIGLATDGANHRIALFAGSGGDLAFESEFFHGAPHDPSYVGIPDLQGYTIDKVTLHVDQIISTSPGTDPAHDGNWSDWSFTGTVSFYGVRDTPEPGSMALALIGALGFGVYRKTRSCRLDPR